MKKLKVLLCDDERSMCQLIGMMLADHFDDCEIDMVNSGPDLFENISDRLPDLILLDIMLPGLNGFEILRLLRSRPFTSQIPVVVLSARGQKADIAYGYQLGADDYVTKPCSSHELYTHARAVLDRWSVKRYEHPLTGFPTSLFIEKQLSGLLTKVGWACLDIKILFYQAFRELYGEAAADDVLRDMAILIREVLACSGAVEDFIGYARDAHFIVTTSENCALLVQKELKAKFTERVLLHSRNPDRKGKLADRKNLDGQDEGIPRMRLAVGVLLSQDTVFNTIHEIVRSVADARRNDVCQ